MSANKDLQFLELRYDTARAGFAVASAEYRTIPAKYPAPVEDAKAAVRYLRAHAKEFGIDPDKIGVLGGSAGGYVVKMLGTTNGEKGWDKGDNLNVSSDVQTVTSLFIFLTFSISRKVWARRRPRFTLRPLRLKR